VTCPAQQSTISTLGATLTELLAEFSRIIGGAELG
jgi:hypothetical protein